MEDKYDETLQEVLDEIEKSLNDPQGITLHQRRLAFLLSLGSVSLLEGYLVRISVLKSGSRINHLWLKKKKDNVKKLIAKQITCPIEELKSLDGFLEVIFSLEKDRNNLAYGKVVSEDLLKEKINLFLELKRRVENA